ncbi:WXG100 family type VII secretion target [Kutzneria sp. NPDC052558]|uniref:WXG100 family type VII secretion target n=1 Tax=Kutzneria sp. NPDC052558 TaxID=3364121 RepID=UPI0037CA5D62
MGEGFSVVTEELAQCGKRVSSMSGQAQSLHGRATAAEVPSRSWGLLGELTTHGKYVELQNQLTDHLSSMTTGLDNAGQRISNTADLYRETDERHKKEITDAGGDKGDPGKVDPGQSGGPRQGSPVDGGPGGGGGPRGRVPDIPDMHGGDSRGPGAGGSGPVGGPGGGAPVGGVQPGLPPEKPLKPVDPGMTSGDGHQNVHGKITVVVEGGGPVTVEVTGDAQEDVEVKGDIQQADGHTEHVDVHAQTDNAGHAKVALKDPAYEHMSGTLLPDTPQEQA